MGKYEDLKLEYARLEEKATQLQKQMKSVTIRISRKDADPFKWKKL